MLGQALLSVWAKPALRKPVPVSTALQRPLPALLDLECIIYRVKRTPSITTQCLSHGAYGGNGYSVDTGSGVKDAVNEALRDWTASYPNTHYLLGTAAGAHPFPTIKEFIA